MISALVYGTARGGVAAIDNPIPRIPIAPGLIPPSFFSAGAASAEGAIFGSGV